jgi:hypothetical protein
MTVRGASWRKIVDERNVRKICLASRKYLLSDALITRKSCISYLFTDRDFPNTQAAPVSGHPIQGNPH